MRAAIAAADAVVFCTPEYAGTLPGSFKNLLDWTVGGAMTGTGATPTERQQYERDLRLIPPR